MMRITAAARSRDGKRFHWRDHCVERGGFELNLIMSRTEDGLSNYTAIYSREEFSRKDLRCDLLVPLDPSVKNHQLRWSASGICDTATLTSEELAEVLLAKLVTLNTSDFSQSDDSR
jgi:hypothetical protein